MNAREHLCLELVRLEHTEEYPLNEEGLTIVICKNGSGKCTVRSATQRLMTGEVMVLNGSVGAKLSASEKDAFEFWSFSVCFENLLPLFSGHEISLLHNLTDSYKTAKIHPAGAPLAKECLQLATAVPEQINLNHRGHLIRIATAVFSVDFKEAQTRRSGFVRAEDHMVQVFERLSPTEFINLSVGELAEKFSCSRRHLNRLFHQHFGVSVASLRMEMRLLKAMSLVRDQDAKVINVAEQCGFNHLGLFNTCFKRRFGASPGQWRKTALQAASTPSSKVETQVNCPLHVNGLCLWSNPSEGPVATPSAEPAKRAPVSGRSNKEILSALGSNIPSRVHPPNRLEG